MSTIDDKETIKELIRNNGVYPGDPQCTSIWEYTNQFGRQTFAVFWSGQNDMETSPWVRDPKLLWSRSQKTTENGRYLLEDKIQVIKVCIFCHKPATSVVDREAFEKWREGLTIQKAFPNLPVAQREMLLNGTHPECWKQIFEGDE